MLFFFSFRTKSEWAVQPSLCLPHTEQSPGQQRVWFQKWTFNQNCLALSCSSPKTGKSGFQIFNNYLAESVRWSVLLSTLLAKDISGTALQWFKSYLSNRSIKVPWRGEVSKSQHLTTGVPQGSVLWPLTFSVYMASLGSVIHKHGFWYHCYADYTQLYLSFHPDGPTIAARISVCLRNISCWTKGHHLHLNLAKTELFLMFHQTHRFNTISSSNTSTIAPSKTARNLGVVIDDQLTFSPAYLLYSISKRSDPFFRNILHNSQFACSSACSVQAGLLGCSLGRFSSLFYQSLPINPERSCKIIF